MMPLINTLDDWKYTKVYEVFNWQPLSAPNNLFYMLRTAHNAPWAESKYDEILFNAYFGMRSNNKFISPTIIYIRRYYNIAGTFLDADSIEKLADLIWGMYGERWVRMWAVLKAEYNPIENYDLTEEETNTYGKTTTRTDNLSHGKTGNDTVTPNLTESSQHNVYGFNTTDVNGKPADKTTTSNTGTNQTTYNTTETDTGTQSHANSGHDDRELTRHGNIGVTTSQQMLQSDIDLWVWNYFNDVVFPDIDRVITIPIY